MRRALYDVLMPAGAVGLLIVFLIAFDGRVREGVMTRVGRGQSSAAVADIGARLTDASSVVFSLIRYETTMPMQITMTGSAVASIETARPWITFVPWPVVELWAMLRTGR